MATSDEAIQSWLANRTQSAWRAVGGTLVLNHANLTFEPNGVDRALGGGSQVISLSDIASVGSAPVNLGHFFGGGLRRRLRVELRNGDVELFVVNKLNRVIAQIEDQVKSSDAFRAKKGS